MEWNLFNFEEEIERMKVRVKEEKKKKYTNADYRKYILENFNPSYCNEVFKNIIISNYFTDSFEMKYEIDPKEQLEYFKLLYNSFTYHLQTDEITIFSMKCCYDNSQDEYSVFAYIHGDFIVEMPRIKDLFNEELCLPACAIWWYNADGTRAYEYLNLTDAEKQIWIDFVKNKNEIIDPVDTKQFSYNEWWRDRREYYFFYKMKIHKYGKPCRVSEKHTYDSFTDYSFTLKEMISYFHDIGE